MASNRLFTGSRLLALLLLFGVIGLVAALLLTPPLLASRDYDERIADLEFNLDRYQRIARLEVPLKTRLAELDKQRQSAKGLLKGESTAIAGANLQELFKQRTERAGGVLESTQILPESEVGGLQRVALRAKFSGNVEALRKILHSVEFGRPVLFVEKIDIRAKQRARRSRTGRPVAEGELSVTLDVAGYRRAEETP